MSFERRMQFAGFDSPDADRPILAAGVKELTVGRKRQASNRSSPNRDRVSENTTAQNANSSTRVSGYQRLVVRCVGHCEDRIAISDNRTRFRPFVVPVGFYQPFAAFQCPIQKTDNISV